MSVKRLLERVSDRDKFSILGYFRENEKKLKLLPVPMLIQYCCLQFYFEFDEFDNTQCHKHLKIKGNHKDKIRVKKGEPMDVNEWRTGCGKMKIYRHEIIAKAYEWSFKICGSFIRWACIGIASTECNASAFGNCFVSTPRIRSMASFYGLHANGSLYCCTRGIKQNAKPYMEYGFDSGDVITMGLNMDKGIIYYRKNGTTYGLETRFGVTQTYNIAVSIGQTNCYVQLVDFKAIYV